MTPQDISCATFIAKHILHQQQTVTDVQTEKSNTLCQVFIWKIQMKQTNIQIGLVQLMKMMNTFNISIG